uniref:Tetratricopeptide repeat protein n=1 Tax=candidate division WWE3 bacterium TaxID=2053526 RepID=A0A7C4TNV5_UNCKA
MLQTSNLEKNSKAIMLFLITLGYVLLLATFLKHIIAEINYADSIRLTKNLVLKDALTKANIAVKMNPKEPRYFYNKSKVLLLSEGPKDEVLKNLQTALELNPNNLVTLKNTTHYYYFLAVKNLEFSSKISGNLEEPYLTLAKTFFSNLKTTYSNDAGVMVIAAKYERSLNLTKEYNETIKRIAELRPDLLNWHPELITPK